MNPQTEETAKRIAAFLQEHKGENTVILNVSKESGWTDFFIISTVNSAGHMRGIVRELRNSLEELNLQIAHKHKKIAEDEWMLIDCDSIIIHLMSEEVRRFYDLERLWYNAEKIDYAS